MRTTPILLVLALGCARTSAPPHPAPDASRAPGASSRTAESPDSIEAANEREAVVVLDGIADRLSEPAEQVFPNIQTLRGTTARTLVNIMAADYSRALGVRCSHCHVEGDYTSDAKRAKRATREMAVMHRMINQELRKMENLESSPAETRAIKCITCHQGRVNPMAP
jgi:hypothetical protein